jgi:hypothetical protein
MVEIGPAPLHLGRLTTVEHDEALPLEDRLQRAHGQRLREGSSALIRKALTIGFALPCRNRYIRWVIRAPMITEYAEFHGVAIVNKPCGISIINT